MEKKIKLIVLIVALIVVAAICFFIASRWAAQQIYEDVTDMTGHPPEAPSVTFNVDKTGGTITITSIEGNPAELVWSNVELLHSNAVFSATLPTGTIDQGDVITDCQGPVLLIWKPNGAFFIQATFD
jgi:hypothetical protein